MVQCEFTGTTQTDTTWPIPDKQWMLGRDTVRFIYEGSAGDTLVMDVDRYEFSYDTRLDTVACGECGDSVRSLIVIPSFDYRLSGDGIQINIHMDSDRNHPMVQEYLKCVDGYIEFTDETGRSLRFERFTFDCNNAFDLTEAIELNNEFHNHNLEFYTQDSIVNECVVDSANIFFIDKTKEVSEFAMGLYTPIMMFNWAGQCWHYDTIMAK